MSAETTLSPLKALSLRIPVDALTEPRLSAGYDVVLGMLDFLLEANRAPGPTQSMLIAKAKQLEQLAHGTAGTSVADGLEYKLGRALGALVGPVAILKGITPANWGALMPIEVAAMSPEQSPVASAADSVFGSLAGFAEGVVNTFLPDGFETDLDDSGAGVDLIDAGQDAINLGAGDESQSNTSGGSNLQAAATIANTAQTVLSFL